MNGVVAVTVQERQVVKIDVSLIWVYHLTWMDAQLSRFWRSEARGYLQSPDPCSPSPVALSEHLFRRNGSYPRVEADQPDPGAERRLRGYARLLLAKALGQTRLAAQPWPSGNST